MVYQPYRATVTFLKTGEPEIIMQESFPCGQEYSAADWSAAIERDNIDYAWLSQAVQVISVTYWYEERKGAVNEPNHKGAHRR